MPDTNQETAPQNDYKTGVSQSHQEDNSQQNNSNNDQNALEQQSQESAFRFDHIAQQVPDIAEAVSWYRALLPQVRVLYQDDSWAFVDVVGTKLAFVKEDQHPNHLAWRVSDAQLEQLAAKHNQTIALHRDKTRSFYLEGPGHQWIEIISFDDSDWENSKSAEKA